MIRLHRPASPPAILRTKGRTKRRAHCAAYTRRPGKFQSGDLCFDFDKDIYGHADVKAALKRAQHDKCAFCEAKVTHIAYGDIEHFRPKAGFRQKHSDPLKRPGYYWLAYEWENLLFSCQICNQRFKGNEFPLANPKARARSHRDDFTAEEPMFVDPYAEDPSAFISFRKEVVYALGGDARGRSTIKTLGLARRELIDRRRDYLDLLKATFILANDLSTSEKLRLAREVQEAQDLLRRVVKDSGEYASMARTAIASWQRLLKSPSRRRLAKK